MGWPLSERSVPYTNRYATSIPPLPIERLAPGRFAEPDHVPIRMLAEHLLQFAEAGCAAVADRRDQVLQHVAKDRTHRSARRDGHLHPFGAERLDVGRVEILD